MDDLISIGAALEALDQIKYALWEIDIPSPGNVPEYIEHHEGVQRVMKRIDELREKMEQLPTAEPEIIRCKDCKHRPYKSEDKQGFGVEFPDEICPCQCEDGWYNWRPDDDWFCANAERRNDG